MSLVVRMCEALLFFFCKTDVSEEMMKRLCEVICVAPWTSLDLSGETAMSDERIVKRVWKELHSCINRNVDKRNRSKNGK